MKLSKNLWLSEVTKSNTAIRRGIDNNPTELHIANLTYLAEKYFNQLENILVALYLYQAGIEVKH